MPGGHPGLSRIFPGRQSQVPADASHTNPSLKGGLVRRRIPSDRAQRALGSPASRAGPELKTGRSAQRQLGRRSFPGSSARSIPTDCCVRTTAPSGPKRRGGVLSGRRWHRPGPDVQRVRREPADTDAKRRPHTDRPPFPHQSTATYHSEGQLDGSTDFREPRPPSLDVIADRCKRWSARSRWRWRPVSSTPTRCTRRTTRRPVRWRD